MGNLLLNGNKRKIFPVPEFTKALLVNLLESFPVIWAFFGINFGILSPTFQKVNLVHPALETPSVMLRPIMQKLVTVLQIVTVIYILFVLRKINNKINIL